ncbi:LINE-1 type transposase domain containing protein 1 [Dissostichus eleginoides]|uniref:LINE-1 type transposase domain containing protein 1 n=1 Tax=Dissostichus eleginoides TaxID=100907 RepID=A0AAD9CLC4_DISEL|nr:LINE-1 type transposase domain containing protein 1 [Dissostichus eleginoides]
MPRAFVIKFLRYRDAVRILEAARKKRELTYGNSKIMLFPDLSPTLHKKRMAFNALKRQLRQADVRYGMFYPATLKMDTRSGTTKAFDSVDAAERFLLREYPDMF